MVVEGANEGPSSEDDISGVQSTKLWGGNTWWPVSTIMGVFGSTCGKVAYF